MNTVAQSILLRDVVRLDKGKPPALQDYFGANAGLYLTPEYLRGKGNAESVKPSANAVFVEDGETIVLWDGSNAGEIFRAKKGVLASTMSRISHGDEYDRDYFYYALKGWEEFLKGQTSGSGIPHVDKEVLGKLQLFEFVKPEQTKIAEVLSTVDRAIEQTEALIAKQQRIKTGLMQDLLSKGIDEQGNLRSEATHEFKDSPLGRIPVEWDVSTVGNTLLRIEAGKSPDCPDRPAGAGEWGVLKVSAVHPDGFLSSENKVVLNPLFVNPQYEVHDNDLLISRSNTPQLVGIVCLVRSPQERLMLCDKTLRLVLKPTKTDSRFLFWVLQQPHIRRQIETAATGTSGSMKNISQPAIRSLSISLPTLSEQEYIADRIAALQSGLDGYAQSLIKLRALKTALMQDLLTGKKRVTPLLESAATD
jgi:type I restriction enzyme S subunit